MAKRQKFMSDKEFRETDWQKVFEDFGKLDKRTQKKISDKALKDLGF